jgi:hypothetical protein
MEDALHEITLLRQFTPLTLDDPILEESTILFRVAH